MVRVNPPVWFASPHALLPPISLQPWPALNLPKPPGKPLAHELRPQSKSDMMAWSRHEALQYTLDFQASILYELSATCDMADVLGISSTTRLFDRVRRGCSGGG